MIDFVQLQEKMKESLERDRTIRLVEAEGESLEEAVFNAATSLVSGVNQLE